VVTDGRTDRQHTVCFVLRLVAPSEFSSCVTLHDVWGCVAGSCLQLLCCSDRDFPWSSSDKTAIKPLAVPYSLFLQEGRAGTFGKISE